MNRTRIRIILVVLLVIVSIVYLPGIVRRTFGDKSAGKPPVQAATALINQVTGLGGAAQASRETVDISKLRPEGQPPVAQPPPQIQANQPPNGQQSPPGPQPGAQTPTAALAGDNPFIDQQTLTASQMPPGMQPGVPPGIIPGLPQTGTFPGAVPGSVGGTKAPPGPMSAGITAAGIGSSNGVEIAILNVNGTTSMVRVGEKIGPYTVSEVDLAKRTVTLNGPGGSMTLTIGGKPR